MKTNLRSLMAILLMLSAMVEQAHAEFNVDDIGVIAVTNDGQPITNPDPCTTSSYMHFMIQANFNTVVAGIIDAATAIEGGGRKQVNCNRFCRGFPDGQCYSAAPNGACSNYRELEEVQQEISTNLRGGDGQARELTIPQLLNSGFWEGYEHEHPEAREHCLLLLSKIQPTMNWFVAFAGKLGCDDQFSAPMLVGCVNLAL